MGDEPKDPGEGRLLPGEGSSTNGDSLEAIRHWLNVYTELYEFKEHLLEEIAEQEQSVTAPGQAELDNDRTMIEREAARIRRRVRFWEEELKRRTDG